MYIQICNMYIDIYKIVYYMHRDRPIRKYTLYKYIYRDIPMRIYTIYTHPEYVFPRPPAGAPCDHVPAPALRRVLAGAGAGTAGFSRSIRFSYSFLAGLLSRKCFVCIYIGVLRSVLGQSLAGERFLFGIVCKGLVF